MVFRVPLRDTVVGLLSNQLLLQTLGSLLLDTSSDPSSPSASPSLPGEGYKRSLLFLSFALCQHSSTKALRFPPALGEKVVCVCVCVCVRACVRACARVRAYVRVRACVCVCVVPP